MRRLVVILSLIVGLTGLVAGCGSGSFVDPPAPERPSSIYSGSIPTRAKELALILPAELNDDLALIESVARLEAGNLKTIYRMLQPKEGDPTKRQAELIKQAVTDGASALLVVPDNSKETAEALAAVDQTKTPIVLIGRPLSSPSGGTPYTLVSFPSFAASARKIADAINADAKRGGFAPDAPIIMLKAEPADETSQARDTALVEAFKTTKHPVAATILVTSSPDAVKPTLQAAVKEHPNVQAVIADNDPGFDLATAVRGDRKLENRFLIGAYVLSRTHANLINNNQVSILVERNVDTLVRRAMKAALDRAEGKTVPDKIEIEPVVRRATNVEVPPARKP